MKSKSDKAIMTLERKYFAVSFNLEKDAAENDPPKLFHPSTDMREENSFLLQVL